MVMNGADQYRSGPALRDQLPRGELPCVLDMVNLSRSLSSGRLVGKRIRSGMLFLGLAPLGAVDPNCARCQESRCPQLLRRTGLQVLGYSALEEEEEIAKLRLVDARRCFIAGNPLGFALALLLEVLGNF